MQQTICLIRHGEVEGNILLLDRRITIGDFNNLVIRIPHEPINERGIEQVHSIIPRVADLGLTSLYSSPLLRARQTARILAEAVQVPLLVRDDLYELLPAPLRGPHQREHTLKGAYIRSGIRLGNPFTRDTETALQAFRRIRRAWQEMTDATRTNFGIIGHQGIFRLLFTWLKVSPRWKLVEEDTSNSGISIVTRDR